MATKLHSAVAAGSRHGIHQLEYPDAANRIAGTGETTGATPKDFDVAKQADDDSLWLLTNAAGPTWDRLSGGTVSEEAFLPIAWAREGASSPAAATDVTSGNGTVQIRDFDSASVEDLVFPWIVPSDIVAASGITFHVLGVITNSTPPASGEGVSFKLSGYSVGTGDAMNGTFGTEVESNDADLFASGCTAQYDVFETTESGTVTVTNLAAGEVAFLHFERDTADADDDYGQDVGVIGIVVSYTRSAS